MTDRSLSLLNLFEVVMDGEHRHFVCFLDPVLAGSQGIDSRSVVGEFTPGPSGGFNLESFRLNPEFVAVLTQFMNHAAAHSPDAVREASAHPGGWLYIIDPRSPNVPDADVAASDVVGCFAVDETGQIVPNSFQYNKNHAWFDAERGDSGLLADRAFYDWLHPIRE